MGSSQSRIAKIEFGNPSISLDLIIRALLTTETIRQELAQAIMDSDNNSDRILLFCSQYERKEEYLINNTVKSHEKFNRKCT